jgi:VanZ family protein
VKDKPSAPPRYRLLHYLVASYALFIVYASLTPFTGWQDQGLSFVEVLTAPLAQTFTGFDFILNCLAYLPLGFLLAYLFRGRVPFVYAAILAAAAGLLLSLAMEYAQMYLPARVSSNTDLLSNTIGTFCGALLALTISRYTWLARIASWHDRWFKHGKINDFGLALIALWIFAQINPTLPMLGSVIIREVPRWPFDIVPVAPFNWIVSSVVALNLLLLGILLLTLIRERRHTMPALLLVLGLVTLVKFVAAAVLLKSWAILLWINSEALLGILAGFFLLHAAMHLTHRLLLTVGALAAIFYLALVLDLFPGNAPSSVLRLYQWHYIHMLNYNGLTRLVNLLFPLLLLGYLWRTGILRK